MDLVDTTIPVGGVLVADAVIAPAVIDYVMSDNSSSETFTDVNSFDPSIYRRLSMQEDMKTYAIERVSNEFDLFLQYGNEMTDGAVMSPEFLAFNNYLGSLGV